MGRMRTRGLEKPIRRCYWFFGYRAVVGRYPSVAFPVGSFTSDWVDTIEGVAGGQVQATPSTRLDRECFLLWKARQAQTHKLAHGLGFRLEPARETKVRQAAVQFVVHLDHFLVVQPLRSCHTRLLITPSNRC